MEWIGLDLSCEHPDWSGFGQKKWNHVQFWPKYRILDPL